MKNFKDVCTVQHFLLNVFFIFCTLFWGEALLTVLIHDIVDDELPTKQHGLHFAHLNVQT